MIGGFGATELLILLGIVLLVFGAGKVPKVGKHLGAGIKNFKDALSNNDDEDNKKLEDQA
jgi:sec-independent protein translocase protein TatA